MTRADAGPARPFLGDDVAWDARLARFGATAEAPWARPHILQTADWAALKARWGWRVTRLWWGAEDAPAACAQILTRRVGGLPLRVGYVPKGPIVAGDASTWAAVLGDLAAWARRAGLAQLKIDADVPAGAHDVREAWRGAGWQPSPEAIQFPNTMVSALADDAALLGSFAAKTRYNLRLAERREVAVRRGTVADLDQFHALYAGTGARQGFAVRAAAYYRDAWTALLASGRGALLVAERAGEPLAAAFPVAFGDTAWYLYGASADHGREHMASYAAMWAALRWARDEGCGRFDWWGGPARLAPDDPLWGVYRFKLGFGAAWVEQLGAWDLPAVRSRHAAYRVLAVARRRALALRRARKLG